MGSCYGDGGMFILLVVCLRIDLSKRRVKRVVKYKESIKIIFIFVRFWFFM